MKVQRCPAARFYQHSSRLLVRMACTVSIGLIWMIALMIQLSKRGITAVTRRKITIISLYWHFLDVVWIFLFTVVYLMGVM